MLLQYFPQVKGLSLMYLANPAVSASVSCMDIGNLQADIRKVEASDISFFHYDVVDGSFNKCYILGDIAYQYLKKNILMN